MSEIFEKAQVSAHEFTSEGVSGFPNAKDGSSLGVVGDDIFFKRALQFVWKNLTLLVDISMTYHLRKDQGSNDNDQKSHFFLLGRNGSEVQRLIV